MAHTILLVQPGARPETRTFCDYESVNECIEGVCKRYEEYLKQRYPHKQTIKYEIGQLYDFIDTMKDICCMVHQKSTNSYIPFGKEWIKDKIYVLLSNSASRDSA